MYPPIQTDQLTDSRYITREELNINVNSVIIKYYAMQIIYHFLVVLTL
jgi:hypothetical protein